MSQPILHSIDEAGPTSPTFDGSRFRAALGMFLTGVTVVTTLGDDGRPGGLTANSFTSVSLEPPLILVCIGKSSSLFRLFEGAKHFAVNILCDAQKATSSQFASRSVDRFAGIEWQPGRLGSPVLSGVAAWFECEMHKTVDAGDHLIVIGRVVEFAQSNVNPLGFSRGSYFTPSLTQSAVSAASNSKLRIGTILETWGALALFEGDDEKLQLLSAGTLGSPGDPSSLLGMADGRGLKFTLGFLFSVFEDEVDGVRRVSIYYRGTLEDGMPPTGNGLVMVPKDSIPWDRLGDDNERRMLRRYVRESQENVFSIYSGSHMQAIRLLP